MWFVYIEKWQLNQRVNLHITYFIFRGQLAYLKGESKASKVTTSVVNCLKNLMVLPVPVIIFTEFT